MSVLKHTGGFSCFSPLTINSVYLTVWACRISDWLQFQALLCIHFIIHLNFIKVELREQIDYREHLSCFIFCQSYIDAWWHGLSWDCFGKSPLKMLSGTTFLMQKSNKLTSPFPWHPCLVIVFTTHRLNYMAMTNNLWTCLYSLVITTAIKHLFNLLLFKLL